MEHFSWREELCPSQSQLRDDYGHRQTVLQTHCWFQNDVVAGRCECVAVRVLEEYLLHCAYCLGIRVYIEKKINSRDYFLRAMEGPNNVRKDAG